MLPIARAQTGITRKALGIWGNCTSVVPSWGSSLPVRSARSIPAPRGTGQRAETEQPKEHNSPRSLILPSSHLQTATDPEHLPRGPHINSHLLPQEGATEAKNNATLTARGHRGAELQAHEHREQQRAAGGLLPGAAHTPSRAPQVLPHSCTPGAALARPDRALASCSQQQALPAL